MPIRFEAYTSDGVRRGIAIGDARLGDLIELERELRVTSGHLAPLDGSPPISDPPGGITLATDDLFVVVAPPRPRHRPSGLARRDPAVRAVPGQRPDAHHAGLRSGPGAGPSDRLVRPPRPRPAGPAAAPDGGSIEHPLAWVNRYVVERVESDLELGFFFPGAESHIVQETYTPGASLPPAPLPAIAGPVAVAATATPQTSGG